MSNNLDSSVSEYLALLKKRCPKVCPSIFPSSYNPKSIDQLCSTSQQINELSTHFKLKAHSIDQHQEISCLTSLNFEKREVEISAIKSTNELDSQLYSLERSMKIITVGGPTEVRQLVELYIEVNELDVDFGTGSQMLYEALQLAFSIKVLISNVHMEVTFRGCPLPLDSTVDTSLLLSKQAQASNANTNKNHAIDGKKSMKMKATEKANKKTNKDHQQEGEGDVDNDDIDVDESTEYLTENKKKKRKRGGGKAKISS